MKEMIIPVRKLDKALLNRAFLKECLASLVRDGKEYHIHMSYTGGTIIVETPENMYGISYRDLIGKIIELEEK